MSTGRAFGVRGSVQRAPVVGGMEGDEGSTPQTRGSRRSSGQEYNMVSTLLVCGRCEPKIKT